MSQKTIGWDAGTPPTSHIVRRFSLYTISIIVLAALLPLLANIGSAAAFKENGLVEWLQIAALLGSAFVFLRASKTVYTVNFAFVVLASFAAFAATRELDAIIDPLVPVLGWKVAYAFILFAGFLYYQNKREVSRQVREVVASNGFFLLWAGFTIAIPFAQLVGNTAFLQAVMAEDYSRDYRRIIEELGELMGYGLILIGSIELTINRCEQQRFQSLWGRH